jgi:uncharacterized protein (DUF1800 family)
VTKSLRPGWVCVGVLAALSMSALAQVDDAAQERAAKTFAGKAPVVKAKAAVKPVALTPLTPRERVEQLVDRFTYGPRPGEVDRVMAMGADKWVAQQMNPDSVPDGVFAKRASMYAALGMQPGEAIFVFPNQSLLDGIVAGKAPYPADPLLKGMLEVQVEKVRRTREGAKALAGGDLTDAQKAADKKAYLAAIGPEAERVAGVLLALPKGERMAALLKIPVEDRIAFTSGSLPTVQRDLLFGEATPREAETLKAMSMGGQSAYLLGDEMAQAHMLRDVLSERQMQAVMTNFWFNHFNVLVYKDSDQWYGPSYERDAIAKHALGNFRDLLLATAESPAMMVYLDNWLSIGPDSLANGVDPKNPKSKKGGKGLNENYGREVMELHTVGVNGGYTQADVTSLAAILTGWGVKQPYAADPFAFDPKRHEPGPKVWFGYVIDEDGKATKLGPGVKRPAVAFGPSETAATADSMKQGIAALNLLAASPETAKFISTLLVQYFVADTPPASLVNNLQRVFLASHGDIKTVLRALIASPEFNSRQYFRTKVKTPEEYVASAFRATATDPQNPGVMVDAVKKMGMPLYGAVPPTGYYLTAAQWMNSAALVDRLNFAFALTNGKLTNQKFDASRLLTVGLMGSQTAGGGSAGGPDVAMKVLEATIIGAPVSAKTNALIAQQMKAQPATANPTDMLNLLAALVLGAPEFQVR